MSRKQGGRGGRLLGGSTGQPPRRQSSTAVPPELPLHRVTAAPAKRRGERRGSRRTDGGKASFPHRCIAAYFNRKTRRKTYQSSFAPPSARKERGRGGDFSSSLFGHIFHGQDERCVHKGPCAWSFSPGALHPAR